MIRTPLKTKQRTAKKLKGEYFSVLTDNLSTCIVTGDIYGVQIHHIFGASRKALSEKYGFVIPLRYDWHEGTTYSIHQDREMELHYKRLCQEYYLAHYGRKEDFIKEFGKWW